MSKIYSSKELFGDTWHVEKSSVVTGLETYYGNISVCSLDGKFYMGLDSWDDTRWQEITKPLYDLLKEVPK